MNTAQKSKSVEWILRIAIFGEFLGHGVFAIQGKETWIKWITELLPVDASVAAQLLLIVGVFDIAVAIIMLVKPYRGVLVWAAVWGFFTALLRPLVGEPVWDFIERWANWGAPLALFMLRGLSQISKGAGLK